VSFTIFSLAIYFLQAYKAAVSSKSSGGEHDSTGLGAKQKLNTPLLRCASPEIDTLYSALSETTQRKKQGSLLAPLFRVSGGRLCLVLRAVLRNLMMVVPNPLVPVGMPVV
jgi:hypothetical protein